jgi:acyl-CoA synthetase (AMP-forming)/AMP-acid ligase II
MPSADVLPPSLDEPADERLACVIRDLAAATPERPAIVADAGSDARRCISYGELAKVTHKLEAELNAANPRGVIARVRTIESLVALAAACGRQGTPVAFLADDSRDLLGELNDWVEVDESLTLPPVPAATRWPVGMEAAVPHVTVATSGTSGPPKLVRHSWESVLSSARLAAQWHDLAWLFVYDPTRWAGIQVWAQALLTAGRLVVPASRDPDTVARAIVDEAVTILPATPTLLRRLLTSADPALLAKNSLKRITLGGEAADAELLARAHEAFPQAGIAQVYATTELGEVYRVADGLPGFPAKWIGKPLVGGVVVGVRRDGELMVRASRDAAEVGTGDLVELHGDRYVFAGRRTDAIIVGGAKVFPKRVEEVIREVPGVAEARVFGVPSSVTGELVAAEIMLTPELASSPAHPAAGTGSSDGADIKTAVLAHCRDTLEPHAVPRLVEIVKKIITTAAGKTSRRS